MLGTTHDFHVDFDVEGDIGLGRAPAVRDSQETPGIETYSRRNMLRRKRSDEFANRTIPAWKRLTMLAELRSSAITKTLEFVAKSLLKQLKSSESNLGSGREFPRTTDESTD
jgi:hypothetical protein